MTKEQEVFEKVNRIRIDFFDSKYKDVHTDDELEEKYEALGDVLSMLKEKDKEIESLEKTLDEKYIFVTGARTLYARLMSLDKENIVKDDLKLRNEIYQHIEDKEKKDKQIDLMAEYIASRDNDEDICTHQIADWCKDEEDGVLIEVCRKCIKQYFERKCEE